jgi:lysophospholipase L1-like esterase
MKNILLIGDSIRFGAPPSSPGYGVYVKEMLADKANVYAPDDNCRFAQYTLRYLYDWAQQFDAQSIDVIHWNNGLWDVLRLNGDEPLTPLDMYVNMLERIYNMMRNLFPDAKIIFANSTTVKEAWANPAFMRYNAEIDKYNDAAKALMDKLGVTVNDLNSITKNFDDSLRSDWVHYGEEGSKILADAVVKKITEIW